MLLCVVPTRFSRFAGFLFVALVVGLVLTLTGAARATPPTGRDDAATLTQAQVKLDHNYRLLVDGQPVALQDVGPVARGGDVFVPIRVVTEFLGARVEWIETDRVARISRGVESLRLAEGETRVRVGQDTLTLKQSPFIYRGRLMVPLIVTARGIGMEAQKTSRGIEITSPRSGANQKADRVMLLLDATLWTLALLVLLARLAPALKEKWGALGGLDIAVLLGCLFVLTPLIFMVARSHAWAALVPAGAALTGVMSRESTLNRLASMAAAAQGLGLIGTLLGLGLIIGPAVASQDVSAIGYGISVKIEASIAGLGLSLLLNLLLGFESRE